MKDVADILDLKDSRSAKKWLHKNNVTVSQLGNRPVVCQFTFELKRQQILVEELRLSYPNNWFKIYDAHTEDKKLVESIRVLYPETGLSKKKRNSNIKRFIK